MRSSAATTFNAMLYNALRDLLVKLINELIQLIPALSDTLILSSLKIESILNTINLTVSPLTAELIQNVYDRIYLIILVLVALRCIWKGFQVYVLWRDGDADVSPHNLITGVALALIVSVAFPTLYNIGVAATIDIGTQVIETINDSAGYVPYDPDAAQTQARAVWDSFFAEYDKNGDDSLSSEEEAPLDKKLFDDATFRKSFVDRLLAQTPQFYQGRLVSDDDYDTVRDYIHTLAYDGKLNIEALTVEDSLEWVSAKDSVPLLVIALLYLLCYLVLFLKLLGRGAEMLFLRWGFPIAAMGLVNSDGGIFPSYVQLLLKQMATSLIQVTALILSLYIAIGSGSIFGIVPTLSSDTGGVISLLVSISILFVAFRAPALLSQIMTPQGSGGGLGQKLYTGMMLKSLLTKGKG